LSLGPTYPRMEQLVGALSKLSTFARLVVDLHCSLGSHS
jgi:hypothetical protein